MRIERLNRVIRGVMGGSAGALTGQVVALARKLPMLPPVGIGMGRHGWDGSRRSRKLAKMVRRGAILVLLSAAILLAAIAFAGFSSGVLLDAPGPGRVQGYLHSADGLIRLYVFMADEPIRLVASSDTRVMTVRRASDQLPCLSFHHGFVPGVTPYRWYWNETSMGATNSPLTVRFCGVRTRVAAPVALLMGYPVFAILRERRRRRRRRPGCCAHCLYDLTGNRSGVCPECGTTIRCSNDEATARS